MNPKITVLLPTYNESENIERSINSILSQTHSNLSLLIVDDGSTDGTIDKIRSIDDDRIDLHIREDGNSITTALNYGIENAEGKYIARQDADDWSEPKRIEKQIQFAEKNNLDIVGCGTYNRSKEGGKIAKREVPTNPDCKMFNSGSQFVHGSLFMKRKMLLDIGGYNDDYRTAEDVELLARASDEGYKFMNINEPLYNFTVDEDSKYRSDVRGTTLHAIHAINKERFDMNPQEFSKLSDQELERLLTDEEISMFYQEMAKESLRFGRPVKTRYYASKNRISFFSISIIALSFTPQYLVQLVVRVYRMIINRRYK